MRWKNKAAVQNFVTIIPQYGSLINPTGRPGVASYEAPHRVKSTPNHALLANYRQRVAGTRWVVATNVSVERGDSSAISDQRQDEQVSRQ